jgi:hypothetical protein
MRPAIPDKLLIAISESRRSLSKLAHHPANAGSRRHLMIGAVGADLRGFELINVAVSISYEHFSEIAEAMMTANPEKASKDSTARHERRLCRNARSDPLSTSAVCQATKG